MTEKQIVKQLIARFEIDDTDSSLNSETLNTFQVMFFNAVQEFMQDFVAKKCKKQQLYGISFEIGNLFQYVYEEDFETYLYFNTEEEYRKQIQDCEEDDKLYYRFEPYSEWDVVSAKTKAFKDLQNFLLENTLYTCTVYYTYESLTRDEITKWYDDNHTDFEEKFEKERTVLRCLMANVLGILRRKGFWKLLGLENLFLIPFSAEDEIPAEEMLGSYLIMDNYCHENETEYVDYLNSLFDEPVDKQKALEYFTNIKNEMQ